MTKLNRIPYQIRRHRDGTVELIISLSGGCIRIYGPTEDDVVRRYRINKFTN